MYGGIFRLVAPSRNGWSRSSARLSIRLAASASVRATMMPGTRMMSSWKRAVLSRLICSSDGTSTLPPWWPHFLVPGRWSSMW